MNIFIVGALHQLMQVKEAIRYFELTANDSLCFFFGNEASFLTSNVNLPIPILKHPTWRIADIYKMDIKSTLDNVKKSFASLPTIHRLFTSQYFSDYSLLACSILKPKEVFVMDEGTASFKVVQKRATEHSIAFNNLIKSALYHTIIKYPKTVTYFTQYNLTVPNCDSVIKYQMERMGISATKKSDYAIILGTSMYAIGMITSEAYYSSIESIAFELREKGFMIIEYYPHRKESKDMLLKIANLNVAVKDGSLPFEFVFDDFTNYPSTLISFASPILDNLSKKYNIDSKMICYFFPRNYYTNKIYYDLYVDIFEQYRVNKQIECRIL